MRYSPGRLACGRVVAHHGTFDLAHLEAFLDNDLAVVFGGESDGGGERFPIDGL